MGNTKDNAKRQERIEKLKVLWKWAYRLRSLVLSAPVAAAAVILAIHNEARLPASVGFNIQASGEYAMMVTREIAVLGPLAVTAVCLLMTICSRKVLYPWLISVFSLVLPWFIYFSNTFSA